MASVECQSSNLKGVLKMIANASKLDPDSTEEFIDAFCAVQNRSDDAVAGTDAMFLLFSAYLVFLMQAGFAALCGGSVQRASALNIMLYNVMDAAVGAIAYYLFGYAFAYGGPPHNGFIGTRNFAMHNFHHPTFENGNPVNPTSRWLHQWAFAGVAAGIASGSIAERTQVTGYLVYVSFLSAFVYPIISHWVWAPSGWISPFKKNPFLGVGMVDFAGSGVVHMTGGIAGFWGARIEGARLAVQRKWALRRLGQRAPPVAQESRNDTLIVLGTCLLWFTWYGFNPGSLTSIVPVAGVAKDVVVARTSVTTTLSAGTAALTTLLAKRGLLALRGKMGWSVSDTCNGLLGGLAAVTAGCSVIEPWAAILLGFLAAWVLIGMNLLMDWIEYDDPLEAFQLHAGCGLLGVLFVGLLAKKEYLMQVYSHWEGEYSGLFYGGGGRLLAAQLIGAICITAWTSVTMGVVFKVLHLSVLLRISEEDEQAGYDYAMRGEPAIACPAEPAIGCAAGPALGCAAAPALGCGARPAIRCVCGPAVHGEANIAPPPLQNRLTALP
ncbi:hypothetical protein CBR_g23898 [Chara braunii]|uniref:Ammonium transporter n=1 Tax=Chara braunii TaxID=69332 RepID=A0A388L548_CHABU|nr:hypothetical protein CBR_g23898 [Chara braunii]|eukprot:GBG77449.1 hypothetical protein CBR_g23898 [Chara braunii]